MRAFITVRFIRHPTVLVAVLLAPSLAWIILDENVWPWDPAWYGEVAVDLWWTLAHAPGLWVETMISAFGSKAPGLSWLAQVFVPLGQSLGSVEFGLLLFVCLTHGLTLLLFGRIGTWLWQGDWRGGFLMILLGGAAPLLIGMSHQFMVEGLQLLAVTYFFWIAVAGADRSRAWLVGHGLIAMGLAMLAKVTSPLYCGLVGLTVLARLWTAPSCWSTGAGRPRLADGLRLLGGIIVCASALAWYWRNQETIREFVQLATNSTAVLEYGRLPEFGPKWKFWLLATQGAFFLPLVGVGLAGSAVVAVAWQRLRPGPAFSGDRWHRGLLLAALLTCIITLFVFTRQINEETRYLLPLLPALLAGFIGLLGRGHRTMAFTAVAALGLIQWFVLNAAALGLQPRPNATTVWLIPVQPDKTKKREVRAVIRSTTTPEKPYRYHVNTYETPWLNANSLSFYAAMHRLKVGYRGYYTSLGYAAMDPEAAWARVEAMQAASLIAVEPGRQDVPPNFLNRIALDALKRAQASAHYTPIPFPNSNGILLYERQP